MASDKPRLSSIKSAKSSQKSISNAANASLDDPRAGQALNKTKKKMKILDLSTYIVYIV